MNSFEFYQLSHFTVPLCWDLFPFAEHYIHNSTIALVWIFTLSPTFLMFDTKVCSPTVKQITCPSKAIPAFLVSSPQTSPGWNYICEHFSLKKELSPVVAGPRAGAKRQQRSILLATGGGTWTHTCIHPLIDGVGFIKCSLMFVRLENLSLQSWLCQVCGSVKPGALHWWQGRGDELYCWSSQADMMWRWGRLPPHWAGGGTWWATRAQVCSRFIKERGNGQCGKMCCKMWI